MVNHVKDKHDPIKPSEAKNEKESKDTKAQDTPLLVKPVKETITSVKTVPINLLFETKENKNDDEFGIEISTTGTKCKNESGDTKDSTLLLDVN